MMRAVVAGKLANEIDSPHLTAEELELTQDIVRIMARDIEVTVRSALSKSLRHAKRMPHDVAVRLANDIESVALPILTHSEVLTDDDLSDIVKNSTDTKQGAVAARANLSEKVSGALIETASENVVATLMGNKGARINETSLIKAVDRFGQSETVKQKMVERPVLPVTVTERLVNLVSENLKNYLASHHELPPGMASDIMMQTRERALVSLSATSSERDLEKLIGQMHANKRLTPSLVLCALCMGDVGFFETAMAVMANVPVVNARILIHDSGGLGLKSLYDKSGMPHQFMDAVAIAIEVVHETPMDGGDHDRERYKARVMERILTQYESLGQENLDYLLEKLGDLSGVSA